VKVYTSAGRKKLRSVSPQPSTKPTVDHGQFLTVEIHRPLRSRGHT